MDSPVLAGALILISFYAVGTFLEWWSWSKPLLAIGTIALIGATLAQCAR